ncbi:hypothetical protein Poly30_02470 [Planctomycetes bacterium Poly30]|uniref:IrrE N-terminal-like domain-containing protein n=1 Tax=Saltatorellus ferox TaxID=2528018 RepID=A0A518EKY0_9BACT|nr:hypothetical protein Poly30_02470 [Planctomycetes bacterium Poly30]
MNYRRRTYDELRVAATSFLAQHHPHGAPPIPIEEIVELKLNLDIAPIPGLKDAMGSEANGYLSMACDTIYVDQFIAENRENRFRFTLAYEVARWHLQIDLLRSCVARNLDEYQEWHEKLPDRVREDSKFEAYDFAGLVLVPTKHLVRSADLAFERAAQGFRNANRDPDEALATIWGHVAKHLADDVFQVSDQVVLKRLRRERILPAGVDL